MREVPINRLAQVMGGEVDEGIRAIKIALFNGVIRDTRVDTGRLRGNWQTTSGSPANGEISRDDPTQQGIDGGVAQDDVIRGVKSDTADFLTNNLSYAEVWEERDGMVTRNVARIDRTVRELLK